MTLAHSGSRLPLSNMTPSLPDGMILFPLDGRVQDTRNCLSVLNNVTTVRDDEKKFFASTAVEDDTTNILPQNIRQNGGTGANKATLTIDSTVTLWGYSSTKVVTNGEQATEGVFAGRYNVSANSSYTFSCYAKGSDLVAISIEEFDTNGTKIVTNWGTATQLSPTEWKRLCAMVTTNANTTQMTVCLYKKTGTTAPITFWTAVWQLENKDHATSWVDGSRDVGCLKYDITPLGIRDSGCVSCWIYNSDTMVNGRVTNGVSINNQYLIKLGSSSSDGYKDTVTIRLPNTSQLSNRKLQFWTIKTQGTEEDVLQGSTPMTNFGQGNWLHVVFQWSKTGLPSGNKKELYINGNLEAANTSTYLPQNMLTYLVVGDWMVGNKLMGSTLFEQLAVHPSKGFSADVIANWYSANAPFFDVKDQLFFY